MDETAPVDGTEEVVEDTPVVDDLPAEESPPEDYPVDDYPVEDVWLDYGVVEGDPGEEYVEILYLEEGDPGAAGDGEEVVYEETVYDETVYDETVYDETVYNEPVDEVPLEDPGVIVDDLPVDYEDLMSETGRPGDVPSDDDLIFYTTANPEIYYTAVQRDLVPESAFGADRNLADPGFTAHDLRSADGGAHFHMV